MSKHTASAAGGATPAEGHKTRRAALALFGAAPALAVFPAVAAASDADAELFELIARWRELDARACALNEQIWALEDATEVKEPDALIKTVEDADLFTTDEEIGEHYCRLKSFAAIEGMISIVMGNFLTHAPIVAMIKRFEEIHAAHRAYKAAEKAAREAAGLPELERLQEKVQAEESRLCYDIAFMQARTVPGLLAKMSAVADIYGHRDLEGDTEQHAGKSVSLEDAAIFVLRDCARITAVRPC
jgi:hypothetical protein